MEAGINSNSVKESVAILSCFNMLAISTTWRFPTVNFDIKAMRHPREKVYGALMLIIGRVALGRPRLPHCCSRTAAYMSSLWPFIWGCSYWSLSVRGALVRAYMFGHHVMVGPEQFPAIHAIAVADAQRLGLSEVPSVFVYNSSGVMNAFAIRLIGRKRYIWLVLRPNRCG